MDFSKRAPGPEWMDSENCAFEDFRDCLRDLSVVNRLTLAYRPTLQWLDRLVAQNPSRKLRIVDVGSGYGDMLRQVARWAARRQIEVELTGVDMNPWSARAAAEAMPENYSICWVTANAFSYMPEGGIDVVISSLFTHHLTDAENIEFLRWMEKTVRLGWFVNDLHRHPVPYYFFREATRFSGWHRFVKHDGPLSIARAFVKRDWQKLLAEAGVAAEVKWRFPFRLCVSRIKPHEG